MHTRAYEKLSKVSFSDGHPIAFAYDGTTLVLDYENWQEKIVRLIFKRVAYVAGYGASASLCEATILCSSPEIDRTKETLAQDWCSGASWKEPGLTQLVLQSDVPILTIIFEDVEIEQLKDEKNRIDVTIRFNS